MTHNTMSERSQVALVSAGVAARQGDGPRALAQLLVAWRELPAPALAARIEALGRTFPAAAELQGRALEVDEPWLALAAKKQPHDLDALLATLRDVPAKRATARVKALAGWPSDPRRDAMALAWLEEMPFRTTGAFWTQLRGWVAAIADPRLRERLAGIEALMAKTWRSGIGETVQKRLAPALAEALERLLAAEPHAGALEDGPPEALQEALEAVDAVLAQGARPSVDAAQAQAEQLLGQILDDPADLALRAVYGDLLAARGDPLGGLVALGFKKREAGKLSRDDAKREKALVRELFPRVAGPLERVLFKGTVELDCGFLSACSVDESTHPQAYEEALGHPLWATVRDLTAPAAVVLEASAQRSLERYHVPRSGFDNGELAKLLAAETALPVRCLSCIAQAAPFDQLLERRDLFPQLRRLELHSCNADAATLWAAPLCAGLDEIVVELPWIWQRFTEPLLELEALPAARIELRAKQSYEHITLEFRAGEGAKKRLEVRFDAPSNRHSLADRVEATVEVLARLEPMERLEHVVVRPSRRIKDEAHRKALRGALQRFPACELVV